MLDRVYRMKRDAEATRCAIERLLDEYGLFVDQDMASVIKSYVKALHLDFELALTRGQCEELALILEDMRELQVDTEARLFEVWSMQGSVAALQS